MAPQGTVCRSHLNLPTQTEELEVSSPCTPQPLVKGSRAGHTGLAARAAPASLGSFSDEDTQGLLGA